MSIPRNDITPPTPPWRPQPPEYPCPPTHPETSGEWAGRLYERLLEQRIVMAHGCLDNEAATRLCAQLLTLDAESAQPIRLELQSLDADLDSALTVMGVLDALRVPVSAYVAGRIRGPALGLLALADHRYAYPSAVFVLSEPRMQFDGTVAEVTAHEEHARRMLGELASKLAALTGRDVEEIRSDLEHQRMLTVDEAIDYGLIEGRAEPRRPARTGLLPRPGD